MSDTTSSPCHKSARISIPFHKSLRVSPALIVRSSVLCYRYGSHLILDCAVFQFSSTPSRLLAPHCIASTTYCLHPCQTGISFFKNRKVTVINVIAWFELHVLTSGRVRTVCVSASGRAQDLCLSSGPDSHEDALWTPSRQSSASSVLTAEDCTLIIPRSLRYISRTMLDGLSFLSILALWPMATSQGLAWNSATLTITFQTP